MCMCAYVYACVYMCIYVCVCIYVCKYSVCVCITHRRRQQCGESQTEKRMGGRWRWARVGGMGIKRYFAWGNGCTMHCEDGVSLSCTLETCIILQTSVTPINSIKNERIGAQEDA